jgi:hypothetical protein
MHYERTGGGRPLCALKDDDAPGDRRPLYAVKIYYAEWRMGS